MACRDKDERVLREVAWQSAGNQLVVSSVLGVEEVVVVVDGVVVGSHARPAEEEVGSGRDPNDAEELLVGVLVQPTLHEVVVEAAVAEVEVQHLVVRVSGVRDGSSLVVQVIVGITDECGGAVNVSALVFSHVSETYR